MIATLVFFSGLDRIWVWQMRVSLCRHIRFVWLCKLEGFMIGTNGQDVLGMGDIWHLGHSLVKGPVVELPLLEISPLL
jgi:hypothetical protein